MSFSPGAILRQIDSPGIEYKCRNDSKSCPAISPFDRLGQFGNIGAQAAGMRRDPDSTKIEAVRIPTRLNRHIRMCSLTCVPLAGPAEQPEFVIAEFEEVAPQFRSKNGGPSTMLWVGNFVDSPRVVQDCEQGSNLGIGSRSFRQSQSVFEDSGPMRNTVISTKRQSIILKNGLNDWLQNYDQRITPHFSCVPVRPPYEHSRKWTFEHSICPLLTQIE